MRRRLRISPTMCATLLNPPQAGLLSSMHHRRYRCSSCNVSCVLTVSPHISVVLPVIELALMCRRLRISPARQATLLNPPQAGLRSVGYPIFPKFVGYDLQYGMVPYLYRPVHTAVSTEYRCNSCSILWTGGGCALYAPSTVQRSLVDVQIGSNCQLAVGLIFEQVVMALVTDPATSSVVSSFASILRRFIIAGFRLLSPAALRA